MLLARTAVVSKAMRKVDSETRKEVIAQYQLLCHYFNFYFQVRDKRLRSLEADNYDDNAAEDNEDGEYSDENVCYCARDICNAVHAVMTLSGRVTNEKTQDEGEGNERNEVVLLSIQ